MPCGMVISLNSLLLHNNKLWGLSYRRGYLVLLVPTGIGNARASNSWDEHTVQTPTSFLSYNNRLNRGVHKPYNLIPL